MPMRRVILLILDGYDAALGESLAQSGIMPALQRLRSRAAQFDLDHGTQAFDTEDMPVFIRVPDSRADMFYGFRCAAVRDPFGHQWMIQHEIEKISPGEMQKRWDAMVAAGKTDCDTADQ